MAPRAVPYSHFASGVPLVGTYSDVRDVLTAAVNKGDSVEVDEQLYDTFGQPSDTRKITVLPTGLCLLEDPSDA